MRKLKKLIASSLIVVSIMTLNPIGVSAEWKNNSKGWWYMQGNSYYTGWNLINDKWYYFYSDGYMAKDTWIDGYYLNISGAWITYTAERADTSLNGLEQQIV